MNPGIVLFLVEVLCFVLGRKIGYDNGLQEGQQHHYCSQCPYPMDIPTCVYNLHRDARDVLTAQDQGNAIPIDWLMSYAQLPTEYAIAEWQKPKKEALIKQIKSKDVLFIKK